MWRLLAAVLITAAFGGSAGAQGVALDDRLPASHWSMDALAYLAPRVGIKGLPARAFIGNRFTGFEPWIGSPEPDRRLSRDEAADIVLQISEAVEGKKLPPQEEAWLAALEQEFLPEICARIAMTKQSFTPTPAPDATFTGSGYFQGRVRDFREENSGNDTSVSGIFRATGGYLAPKFQIFLSLTNERRRVDTFRINDGRYKLWDKLFVNWRAGGYKFTVGRDYLWWGPGYSGSMILSDFAPAYDQIRMQRDFSLGKFFGKVNIQQFAASWRDDYHYYLVGRRYQRELSKSWQIGISETAKTTRTPNPLIAVLPFYLYQKMFIGVDEEFNTLYSLDVKKTFGTRGEAYFDFLVDDWRAPDFLGGTEVTVRKAGLLVGGAVFSKRKPLPDSLRAEFFTIDPETYEASREDFPTLDYYRHKGWYSDCIGYPTGGNRQGIFLRADKWLSDRLELVTEFRCVASRKPDLDGLYGEDWRLHAWDVGLNYDLSERTSFSLRYTDFRRHSWNPWYSEIAPPLPHIIIPALSRSWSNYRTIQLSVTRTL